MPVNPNAPALAAAARRDVLELGGEPAPWAAPASEKALPVVVGQVPS
jgi:hypothetical protein